MRRSHTAWLFLRSYREGVTQRILAGCLFSLKSILFLLLFGFPGAHNSCYFMHPALFDHKVLLTKSPFLFPIIDWITRCLTASFRNSCQALNSKGLGPQNVQRQLSKRIAFLWETTDWLDFRQGMNWCRQPFTYSAESPERIIETGTWDFFWESLFAHEYVISPRFE